jgi:hypothetical protein
MSDTGSSKSFSSVSESSSAEYDISCLGCVGTSPRKNLIVSLDSLTEDAYWPCDSSGSACANACRSYVLPFLPSPCCWSQNFYMLSCGGCWLSNMYLGVYIRVTCGVKPFQFGDGHWNIALSMTIDFHSCCEPTQTLGFAESKSFTFTKTIPLPSYTDAGSPPPCSVLYGQLMGGVDMGTQSFGAANICDGSVHATISM